MIGPVRFAAQGRNAASAGAIRQLHAPVSHAAAPAWLAGNYLWRGLWLGWRFLRQVSGDDAYERYLQHVARFHPEQTPMSSRRAFPLLPGAEVEPGVALLLVSCP